MRQVTAPLVGAVFFMRAWTWSNQICVRLRPTIYAQRHIHLPRVVARLKICARK